MHFSWRQLLPRANRTTAAWLIALILLLFLELFILVNFGSDARNAVADRISQTTQQIETSGQVFANDQAKAHEIFRSIRLREFIASGTWYSAAIGFCILSFLLVTIRWWTQELPKKNVAISYPSKRVVGWILAIAVVGLFVRLPRMDFSLYNDEAYNFTRYTHGQFKWNEEAGENLFKKASWQKTLWGNQFGNNGQLYSIFSRICHDIWQKKSDAVDGEVSEVALRIPSLIAGVASIAMIGLCGVVFFGTRTGIVASLLGALHPWHLRYSTEARSYGMVLLFSTIILFSLIMAIREGRWRWWLIFLFAEVFCLWSYVGSIYFLIAANSTALVWIIFWQRPAFPRWLAANSLAAALFLQLTGPSLPQIAYAGTNMASLQGATGYADIKEITSYLISGMPILNKIPENPLSPAWQNFGFIGTTLFFALATCLLFGVFAFIRQRNASGLYIFASTIGAIIVATLISNATSSIIHHWYVIYALPGFILVMAAAVNFLWSSRWRLTGPLLLTLFITSFTPAARAYLKQGKEPLREVMELMREDVYPFDEKSSHPLVAAFWSDAVYDPSIIYTPSVALLEKAMERAHEENRPLFVEFGRRPIALRRSTDLIDLIENSGKFEHLQSFHGLEETQFSHHVYRLNSPKVDNSPER